MGGNMEKSKEVKIIKLKVNQSAGKIKKPKRPTPWRDENGDLLSDEKLKVISRNWDEKTWNRFLEKVVEVPLRETYEESSFIEEHSEEDHKTFFRESISSKKSLSGSRKIEELLVGLDKRQVIVLKIICNGFSLREISKKTGWSLTSIQRLKQMGIEEIRRKNLKQAA